MAVHKYALQLRIWVGDYDTVQHQPVALFSTNQWHFPATTNINQLPIVGAGKYHKIIVGAGKYQKMFVGAG